MTFVIYGFLLNATTSQSIAIENYKMIRNHGIVKNIVPFSQLSENQINNSDARKYNRKFSITEKIRKVIDGGKFACGVFLDFRKAFDAVNHEILI